MSFVFGISHRNTVSFFYHPRFNGTHRKGLTYRQVQMQTIADDADMDAMFFSPSTEL